MADDVVLNPGTGGDTIAADDVAGVKYQVVKLAVGADGAASLVSNAAPIPVSDAGGALTVDGTVAVSGTVTVDGSGVTQPISHAALTELAAAIDTEVQVDVVGALPAGTNNIGDVDIASIAAGDNNIGNVDVVSIIPGTGATNLGKAEDAAHTTGDVGVMALGVRQSSQADFGADGDYVPFSVDDDGGLRVSIVAGAGSGGTASADDADFTATTTQGTPAMGVYESTPSSVTDGDLGVIGITQTRAMKVAIDSGGISGRAEDSAHSTGHEGVVVLAVRRDTAAVGSDTDGDYSTINVNSAGRVYTTATVDAALPAGNNNIGDVDVASIAAGTNTIGNVGLVPRTSGGLTIFRSIDLDESEEEIKATAGQVYFIHAMNLSNGVRYLKFYNATAANVTVGTTTPVLTFPIPTMADTNGAGFVCDIPQGLAFGTAITAAATTGLADNDTGAPGSSEVVVNIGYA